MEKINYLGMKITREVVVHYLDEIFVLFFTFLGVMASDLITQKIKGYDISHLHFSVGQIVISAVVSFLVYGKFYSALTPNEVKKPPYLKRITNALSQGMAWRTGFELTN